MYKFYARSTLAITARQYGEVVFPLFGTKSGMPCPDEAKRSRESRYHYYKFVKGAEVKAKTMTNLLILLSVLLAGFIYQSGF